MTPSILSRPNDLTRYLSRIFVGERFRTSDPYQVNFAGSPIFGQKAALRGPKKLVGARSGRVNRAQTVPASALEKWLTWLKLKSSLARRTPSFRAA
jgi:hypothetical protein